MDERLHKSCGLGMDGQKGYDDSDSDSDTDDEDR
jgi:hypothetical protein